MKGKTTFTDSEIAVITDLIQHKVDASTNDQKKIRDKIRKLGFYAKEYGIGGGYTVNDFLRVIKKDSMIEANSTDDLKKWIKKYKLLIQGKVPKSNYNELYKWETIKHFQDNWSDDHNEHTIQDVLKKSFNKENNNLWSGSHFLPYKMMLEFAEARPDRVSNMYHSLFDETISLEERLEIFSQ